MAARAFAGFVYFVFLENKTAFKAVRRCNMQTIFGMLEASGEMFDIVFDIARCRFKQFRDVLQAEGIILQ